MIFTRRLVASAAMVALALCASAVSARDRRGPAGPPGAGTANPSALVAAEIAFNRMVRKKGQWKAFDKLADDAAVLFTPTPVLAKAWLRGRDDPAYPVQWEPYSIWMSCDGTLGFTTGAWHKDDGSQGTYTTIWKQRDSKKRDYRWVVDLGQETAQVPDKPDFLTAKVTDCPAPQAWNREEREKGKGEITVTAEGPPTQGRSDDGTLTWRYTTSPAGRTDLTVNVLEDGKTREMVFSTGADGNGETP